MDLSGLKDEVRYAIEVSERHLLHRRHAIELCTDSIYCGPPHDATTLDMLTFMYCKKQKTMKTIDFTLSERLKFFYVCYFYSSVHYDMWLFSM